MQTASGTVQPGTRFLVALWSMGERMGNVAVTFRGAGDGAKYVATLDIFAPKKRKWGLSWAIGEAPPMVISSVVVEISNGIEKDGGDVLIVDDVRLSIIDSNSEPRPQHYNSITARRVGYCAVDNNPAAERRWQRNC